MRDAQDSEKRKRIDRFLEKVFAMGIGESELIRYLEWVTRQPNLIHPHQFEEEIPAKEQKRLDKYYAWSFHALRRANKWLGDVEVILKSIDDIVIIATQHEIIFNELRKAAPDLKEAFTEARRACLELGVMEEIEKIGLTVYQRLNYINPMVERLQDPNLWNGESERERRNQSGRRAKIIKPFIEPLTTIAKSYTESRAQIAAIREQMDPGGNPREGMSPWHHNLAKKVD